MARARSTASRTVFTIEMLPAAEGDCLLIEYGTGAKRSRVLIDCGTRGTIERLRARLQKLKSTEREFDLFVLTHIDGDHVGGAIEFLKQDACGLTFQDVWFNGWEHLPRRRLGARQGEIFSTLIRDGNLPWNVWQDGQAVMTGARSLPTHELPGGMSLTLLSPDWKALERLAPAWEKELKKHGLTPGSRAQYRQFLGGSRPNASNIDALADARFRGDPSRANGSSIGFLAEYGGKRALLVGDAHAPVLVDALSGLLADRGEEHLALDAFKLPHHASQNNLSRELVELVRCDRWLVSTNGSKFHHPDGEAVARIVKYGNARNGRSRGQLVFNYRTKYNAFWDDDAVKGKYGYTATYPAEDSDGIVVKL